MISSASSHMARVSLKSMPKGVSWYGVLERPVPNSTRPLLNMSSVATRSATRSG